MYIFVVWGATHLGHVQTMRSDLPHNRPSAIGQSNSSACCPAPQS